MAQKCASWAGHRTRFWTIFRPGRCPRWRRLLCSISYVRSLNRVLPYGGYVHPAFVEYSHFRFTCNTGRARRIVGKVVSTSPGVSIFCFVSFWPRVRDLDFVSNFNCLKVSRIFFVYASPGRFWLKFRYHSAKIFRICNLGSFWSHGAKILLIFHISPLRTWIGTPFSAVSIKTVILKNLFSMPNFCQTTDKFGETKKTQHLAMRN